MTRRIKHLCRQVGTKKIENVIPAPYVIPAKAGIYGVNSSRNPEGKILDSRVHGNDRLGAFSGGIFTLYCLILSLSLFLMSCGGTNNPSVVSTNTQGGTGQLALSLKWQTPEGKFAMPSGISTVRVSISASDMTTMTQDFSSSSGGGTISSVPAGANRKVSTFGLDGAGAVLYSGYVSGITITGGQTTTVVITLLSTEGAPTASLSADKTSGFAPLTVTFTVGYTDPEAQAGTYSLNFGDSTTASTGSLNSGATTTVSHTYSSNGSSTATLTVTDNAGKTGTATAGIITGGTPLSGTFFSNKTLTLSESPYLVVGNVQIPAGVTLTIEPGVTIAYGGAYEILIKGNIIANGTSAQKITFTTATANTSSGATQLRFADTDMSLSQISYVKMEWAGTALNAGGTGTLSVTNLELANASVSGSVTISNSTVSNATVSPGNITIQDSTATDSTSSVGGGNLIIQRSTLTRSPIYAATAYSGIIKVLDSTLTESKITSGIDWQTLEVSRSQLINSPIYHSYPVSFTITDTTITYSNAGAYGINCAGCNISYSKITGNGSGTGIRGGGSISYMEIRDTSIAVEGGGTISNTNFINNSTYNFKNTGGAITATNNYWGTTDENVIKQKIFDYYDDINYGIVTYSPYLTSPVSGVGPRAKAAYIPDWLENLSRRFSLLPRINANGS